jgi:hypothetical protein
MLSGASLRPNGADTTLDKDETKIDESISYASLSENSLYQSVMAECDKAMQIFPPQI